MNNQAMMFTKVKNIYIMLLHAISKENLSIVDHYLDDALTKRINQTIENNKRNNVRQVFRQQNISDLVIVNEDDQQITLRGETKHITYFVNRKNNKYVSGDNKTRITSRVTLKFKKNNVESKSVIHCPNCGGALQINTTGICTYCGNAVDERFSHYVLYSIE